MNPDIIGHATFVIFPGAELAENTIIRQLFGIGRIRTETTGRKREFLRHSPSGRNDEKLAYEIIKCLFPGAVDDVFTIGCPAQYNVVRAHPVADIVASQSCRCRNSGRDTALCRNGIHFGISIVLCCKRNSFTIGREMRKHFISCIAGKFSCHSTAKGNCI